MSITPSTPKSAALELRANCINSVATQVLEAAAWIAANRPDIALGVAPDMLVVAPPDCGSLAELEEYGSAGTAVKLCDGAFGQLWWCDPEERPASHQECLLYTAEAIPPANFGAIRMRFRKAVTD